MRAVVVEQFGDPGVLRVADIPMPEPSAGQVRVRVAAAGVNPVDSYNVQDPSWAKIELGCTLGYDIAGFVDAVGAGLDASLVGRTVMAMTAFPSGQGGYAEYAVIDEPLVAYLKDNADLHAAAAMPLAAGTAWEVTERVKACGPALLVVGASGGVGLFTLQLASLAGLRPVALGQARSHALMSAHGAAHCIDYTESDAVGRAAEAAGGSFDAIADLVGGPLTMAAQPYLRDDGVICAIAPPELEADPLIDHNQSFHGILIRDNGDRMRLLGDLFNTGRLTAHVSHTLPLEDAAEAHRLLASGEAGGGKIVLTVS
jgi:NADPH:quinone reductase-like Zn-dependent oxidoreductase